MGGCIVRRSFDRATLAPLREMPSEDTLGGLLLHIDQHYGGIVPPRRTITGSRYVVARALDAHGGNRGVEPYLYPRTESLFPYYLLILIHAAGNPEAILALEVDCLQPIPLLDDRELLVWEKRRADTQQRRSFRSNDAFEPPTLIRELVQWTRRLRAHVPAADRNHLRSLVSRIVGSSCPRSWMNS